MYCFNWNWQDMQSSAGSAKTRSFRWSDCCLIEGWCKMSSCIFFEPARPYATYNALNYLKRCNKFYEYITMSKVLTSKEMLKYRSSGIRIRNRLVRKRTLNHLANWTGQFDRPAWLNGWVFVSELIGCGFEFRRCYLNFRYDVCFK